MTARSGSMPRRALVLPAIRRPRRRRPTAIPASETGRAADAGSAGSGMPLPGPPDGAPAATPAGPWSVPTGGAPARPDAATRPGRTTDPRPVTPRDNVLATDPVAAGAAADVAAGALADGTAPPELHLVRGTLSRAWRDRLLGLSAEAAFWSLLSLPPLFLALLGSLGYFSGTLGADTVNDIERHLLTAFSRAFSPSVVDQVIQPMVSELLRRGRADVISIGFLISLWAGSSATSTFVNTVTIAYGMRDLRGAVRSRLLALGLFLLTMIVGVVLLPLLVLGPSVLVELVPQVARGDATSILKAVYWPVLSTILLTGLISFYHLAVPKRLPWRRGVPGALLAAAVFLLGGTALRYYIGFVVGQGLTYGALAAPIAALLFFFVLALAVLLGAELNAMIEEMWPARPTRRQRRRALPPAPPRPARQPAPPAA